MPTLAMASWRRLKYLGLTVARVIIWRVDADIVIQNITAMNGLPVKGMSNTMALVWVVGEMAF